MATIKKAYQEIVSLLEANREETVNDIIDNVIALASAKSGGGGGKATTFHKGDDGTVLAVRCFYHKQWMSPLVVEFGAKASSPTGLSSMCKDGTSKWTKQQREFKQGQAELLAQVATGEVSGDDVADMLAELDNERQRIVPREDGYGFENLEDCLADLEERELI